MYVLRGNESLATDVFSQLVQLYLKRPIWTTEFGDQVINYQLRSTSSLKFKRKNTVTNHYVTFKTTLVRYNYKLSSIIHCVVCIYRCVCCILQNRYKLCCIGRAQPKKYGARGNTILGDPYYLFIIFRS